MIAGVAFKKTFSYAGFEQQPKSFDGARVLLLNVELELKAEKDNAEIRVENPSEYQAFVDGTHYVVVVGWAMASLPPLCFLGSWVREMMTLMRFVF